jgi:hypothetical protein
VNDGEAERVGQEILVERALEFRVARHAGQLNDDARTIRPIRH